jgi:hypothetical protein
VAIAVGTEKCPDEASSDRAFQLGIFANGVKRGEYLVGNRWP